jgi:hypothetical protein
MGNIRLRTRSTLSQIDLIVVVDSVRSCPFFAAIDLKKECILFSQCHSHSFFFLLLLLFSKILSQILVEECKDAILLLSSREDTFFGPYEMPLLNVQLEVEDTEENEENEDQSEVERTEDDDDDDDDDDEENALTDEAEVNNTVDEEIEEEEEEEESKPRHHHMEPSEESREKLSKLEPLPPLLDNFDLDAHVGLIQKLLKEDPELVNMQATLSGR